MKKSELKQKFVQELVELHQALNVKQLYVEPEHRTTKDWLAETASVLKNLDESDYQEFIRLNKTINPTVLPRKRKDAAHEIDTFIRRKVAEWKRYDFSSLDDEKVVPNSCGVSGCITSCLWLCRTHPNPHTNTNTNTNADADPNTRTDTHPG